MTHDTFIEVAIRTDWVYAEEDAMEHAALRTRLAELLRQAERAHGDYEKTLGRRDDDWPDWYAAYIAERLSGDFR